jgi:Ca-activated chloride channel family protein
MLRITKNTIFLACVLEPALLPQARPSFRSDVEMVVVSFTVADASGVAVKDLKRDELRVYDNGVRRLVQSFSIDEDLPLTLGVVIDASESQKDRIDEHAKTAGELLHRILRPGDHAFVISVDEDVRLWIELPDATGDVRKRLVGSPGDLFGAPCPKRVSSIAGLGPWSTCGPSPIWNAIYDAVRIKLQPIDGNKALLVLTDGFDTGSTRTRNQAADMVNRAGAFFYAIQYQSGFGRRFAPELSKLVEDTGGIRFHPPDGDYRQIVSRIETDLRHHYVLGFRPDKLSGRGRHDVRIEVTRPDVTVNARKTYFEDRQ